VTLLLLVLFAVASNTILDRINTTSWDKTLWVGIFPMNADGSPVAESYVRSLKVEDFAGLEAFFGDEAARYGVKVRRPVRIELYPSPRELPPTLVPHPNVLQTMWWSLKMRWYARSAANVPGRPPSHIRVFVLYHDPAINERVPHSLGLQKGLVGVVHAFADRRMAGSNSIVIAHETFHTVGATDKYDLDDGRPIYPEGYAEPDRKPRFPQRYAEIMAGERAISEREQEMPESLAGVRVGAQTAAEIGWTAK